MGPPEKEKRKKSDSEEIKNEETYIFNRNLFIDKDCPVIKEDSKES